MKSSINIKTLSFIAFAKGAFLLRGVWKPLKWLIPLLAILIALIHGLTDTVKTNNLFYEVNRQFEVPFFETPYIYVYLHLFAFIPVLILSFDKKVAYYKRWKYLFPALLIITIIFWIWDIWKTAAGVWGFNTLYYTIKIINLPIEEWLFFFTFPWASVFIYECLNAYFPKNTFFQRIEYPLSIMLIFTFFGVGFWHWGHAYTTIAFIIAGSVLLWQVLFGAIDFRAQFYRSFLIGLIPFILVNGILTGASTNQPIVIYNPEEYLGIRFITIPLDDFVYNFSMLFSVTMLYEYFKKVK